MFTLSRIFPWVYLSMFLFITPLFGQFVWIPCPLPQYGPVINVAVTPNGNIFCDVGDRGLFRTTDDGLNWAKFDIPYFMGTGYIDMMSDKSGVLYVMDGGYRIRRSLNYGYDWEIMNDTTLFRYIAFDFRYRMYIVSEHSRSSLHRILWSDDSGRTVHETVIDSLNLGPVHVTSRDVVFAYGYTYNWIDRGSADSLFRSTDRGMTWVDIHANLPQGRPVRLGSDPAGNVYVFTAVEDERGHNDFHFNRSTDDGETWVDLGEPSWDIPRQMVCPGPGTIIVSYGAFSVLSRDYGETWESFSDGLGGYGVLWDMALMPDGRVVAGGYGGGMGAGIYITSNPVGVEQIAELPSSLSLAQSYPNPVSTGQGAYINFSLPTQEYITLTVYNTSGQEVAQIAQGTFPPGTHTAMFNSANLPTGVYIYRLVAGGRQESRVLIVR